MFRFARMYCFFARVYPLTLDPAEASLVGECLNFGPEGEPCDNLRNSACFAGLQRGYIFLIKELEVKEHMRKLQL